MGTKQVYFSFFVKIMQCPHLTQHVFSTLKVDSLFSYFFCRNIWYLVILKVLSCWKNKLSFKRHLWLV